MTFCDLHSGLLWLGGLGKIENWQCVVAATRCAGVERFGSALKNTRSMQKNRTKPDLAQALLNNAIKLDHWEDVFRQVQPDSVFDDKALARALDSLTAAGPSLDEIFGEDIPRGSQTEDTTSDYNDELMGAQEAFPLEMNPAVGDDEDPPLLRTPLDRFADIVDVVVCEDAGTLTMVAV